MEKDFHDPNLLAPCGMYCGFCRGYLTYLKLQKENKPLKKGQYRGCCGCRAREKQCAFFMKKCKTLRKKEVRFCCECKKFPCKIIESVDKKYNKKYGYSFVENQKMIKEKGEKYTIEYIHKKYKCPKCGWLISVHDVKCLNCGYEPKNNG